MRIKFCVAVVALCCVATLSAKESKSKAAYPDWSASTHSNKVDPNYDEVFGEGKVQRIDITVERSAWDSMWSELSGMFGGGAMGGSRPEGEMAPPMMGGQMGGRPEGEMGGHPMMGQMGERPEGEMAPPMMGGQMGGQMGGGRGGAMDAINESTPSMVPCTVKYNGIEWYQVGLRFKGNSSLMRGTQGGNKKMSFKLDFDEYEEQYPDLKNQRFYGFKKLNLNCNLDDTSFLREKVSADLYREFGLVAAHTTFCELYVDYGEGAQYYGLYTLVEQVDDSLIESSYDDASGNIYKPEERAGSFAEGSFEASQFYFKGGDKDNDYSDVKALYDILNSDLRSSDVEAWKGELESVFDVDIFLKWLAVNTAIQNWDTYGNMAHNYYLYGNPSTGKLEWITWDHNEALQSGRNTYEPERLSQAGASWPLLSYLMADAEYSAKFDSYIADFMDRVFTPEKMSAKYDVYYALLKESVYKEVTLRTYMRYYKQFDESIETLKSQCRYRQESINSYLGR